MKDARDLLIYRDFGEDGKALRSILGILEDLTEDEEEDFDEFDSYDDEVDPDDYSYLRNDFYFALGQIVTLASRYGFSGNLWHNYITYLIVNHENPYSLSCERNAAPSGSLYAVAEHDFAILKDLFDYPMGELADLFGADIMMTVGNYRSSDSEGAYFNDVVREKISELSKQLAMSGNVSEFSDAVTAFYVNIGVGTMGLHKAFRVSREMVFETDYDDELKPGVEKVILKPLEKVAPIFMDELIGYDKQKQALIDNTEAFVNGCPANNCLLYGDAGTGKSTSVKALMNTYYEKGLRVIELYKHQVKDLNAILSIIRKRNYRFIIFMDDLSFEEFEVEYKYLKAVIEGGLEERPGNVLIYATSNRRHLIKETFTDRKDYDPDMHRSETEEEKTSLFSRFGLRIRYTSPERKEFEDIVLGLAKRYDVKMKKADLLAKANEWEVANGGFSGRCARQFIDFVRGAL